MKKDKKEEAIQLRKKGYSIKEIEKELSVARSSVSRWVSNVCLTEQQEEKLKSNIKANALASSKILKEKAEFRRNEFKKIGFEKAKTDKIFALICALYWGEGSKTNSDVRFANSDPNMIRFFINWLVESNYKFKSTIHFYEDNGLSFEDIKNWWINKIPFLNKGDFASCVCKINRASQRKNIGKLPYGTILLRVNKSTGLFATIMGGIDFLTTIECF